MAPGQSMRLQWINFRLCWNNRIFGTETKNHSLRRRKLNAELCFKRIGKFGKSFELFLHAYALRLKFQRIAEIGCISLLIHVITVNEQISHVGFYKHTYIMLRKKHGESYFWIVTIKRKIVCCSFFFSSYISLQFVENLFARSKRLQFTI